MQTRCQVCLQPATTKCTSCGQVFCDLHIRYGGQVGGMYGGGDVGNYCDECWARRLRRRRVGVTVGLALGLILLAAALGSFLLLGDAGAARDVPWVLVTLVVGLVVAGLGIAAVVSRRGR